MSTSNQELSIKLCAPLPSSAISWRVGQTANNGTIGQALPYVDARVVQNSLDEIVGAASWRNSFEVHKLGPDATSIMATIELKIDGEWVAKSDAAQVDSFNSEGNSRELAIKGAYSDAFKRAAVMWGIARYLYSFNAPWVALDESKNLSETPQLPLEMLPESEREAAAEKIAEKEAKESKDHSVAVTAGSNTPQEAPPTVVSSAETGSAEASTVAVAQPVEKVEKVAAVTVTESPTEIAAPVATTTAVSDDEPELRERAAVMAEDEETQLRERAAAMVDQEMGNTPVAPVKSSEEMASVDGVPEGLNPAQLKLYKGVIEKIDKKVDPDMLRNYLVGPKGIAGLPTNARARLLQMLDTVKAAAANHA